MQERDVQRAVLEYLNARGDVFCWRNNKGSKGYVKFGGPDGASDILGYFRNTGRIVAIEIKAPGKKPRADQVAFLAAIERAGGFACWCSDVAALDATLDQFVRRSRCPENG